jgi:hypothetical protein
MINWDYVMNWLQENTNALLNSFAGTSDERG